MTGVYNSRLEFLLDFIRQAVATYAKMAASFNLERFEFLMKHFHKSTKLLLTLPPGNRA